MIYALTAVVATSYAQPKNVNIITKEATIYEDTTEEELYGEMELVAQLVQAEAGNQDLKGRRLVVDVVLNRVDSKHFPNSVEEVIFQENQFSPIKDSGFERAGKHIDDETYEAVRLSYQERLNYDILFFSRGKSEYAKHHFKHQDHWFGY